MTVGFTGADLANLMNEAAILAARRGASEIGTGELSDAFERIVAGPERGKHILSGSERRVVAYHEAGHALVMESLPDSDRVRKVSIVSRGAALGYTMPLPERDKMLRSRKAFEDEIAGLLGGRAAEELHCGGITTGAANDLERATSLARAMVTQYGMSEELGLRTFGTKEAAFPDWSGGQQRDYAEGTALKIDAQISAILDQAYEKAKAALRERWSALVGLATALLENETLERTDIERVLAGEAQGVAVPCADEAAA
jgi:cell division protease FtsH